MAKVLIVHTVTMVVETPIQYKYDLQILKEKVGQEVRDMFMNFVENPEEDMDVSTYVKKLPEDIDATVGPAPSADEIQNI